MSHIETSDINLVKRLWKESGYQSHQPLPVLCSCGTQKIQHGRFYFCPKCRPIYQNGKPAGKFSLKHS